MKTNNKLDTLVQNKIIKSYSYHNVDCDGNLDSVSRVRNSEKLVIEFNDGEKLSIDTFCSGSAENTVLSFDVEYVDFQCCAGCIGMTPEEVTAQLGPKRVNALDAVIELKKVFDAEPWLHSITHIEDSNGDFVIKVNVKLLTPFIENMVPQKIRGIPVEIREVG